MILVYADALEVKDFDKNAIILDDGGDAYFDLETLTASRERQESYKIPDFIPTKNDYFWRNCISFNPNKTLLKRLLIKSINRAHQKSECLSNYFYSIYLSKDFNDLKEIWKLKNPQNYKDPIITFNCRKNSNPFDIDQEPLIHSHLFIESKALFAVLTGITHWNNYEVGSVFQVRRVPDEFNRDMQSYLTFLSVI